MAGSIERSSRFTAKGLLRSLLTVRATSSVHVTVPDAQDIPDSSFTGEWFFTMEGHRRTASNVVVGGKERDQARRDNGTRAYLQPPEADGIGQPHLGGQGGEEISMGATLSAIAMNTELPMEVVMEAMGPVIEEGSPLKGYD